VYFVDEFVAVTDTKYFNCEY